MNLETIKTPKGELLSPITKAIVQHVEDYGPCDVRDISTALLQIDGYSDDAQLTGLQRRLLKLRDVDHLHRVLIKDVIHWMAGPQPVPQAPKPPPGITPPRRHNCMSGPAYASDWSVARPGALDYAAKPSLHMGNRRAFRSDVV